MNKIGKKLPTKNLFGVGEAFRSTFSYGGEFVAYNKDEKVTIFNVRTGELAFELLGVAKVALTWDKKGRLFCAGIESQEIEGVDTNIFMISKVEDIYTVTPMSKVELDLDPDKYRIYSMSNIRTEKIAFVFFPVVEAVSLVAIGMNTTLVLPISEVVTIGNFTRSAISPSNPMSVNGCWFRNGFAIILANMSPNENSKSVVTDSVQGNSYLSSVLIDFETNRFYYDTIRGRNGFRNLAMISTPSTDVLTNRHNDFMLFRRLVGTRLVNGVEAEFNSDLVRYCTYTREFTDLEIPVHPDQSKVSVMDYTGRFLMKLGSLQVVDGLPNQSFDVIDTQSGQNFVLTEILDENGNSLPSVNSTPPISIGRAKKTEGAGDGDGGGEGDLSVEPTIFRFRNTQLNQDKLELPLLLHEGESTTIDWGDGTVETFEYENFSSDVTDNEIIDMTASRPKPAKWAYVGHEYAEGLFELDGDILVKISGYWGSYSTTGAETVPIPPESLRYNFKLLDVLQWGNTKITSLDCFLYRHWNITTFTATDSPNFTENSTMIGFILGHVNFRKGIAHWDVSKVVDMTLAFPTWCSSIEESTNDEWDSLADWRPLSLRKANGMFAHAHGLFIVRPLEIAQWELPNLRMAHSFHWRNNRAGILSTNGFTPPDLPIRQVWFGPLEFPWNGTSDIRHNSDITGVYADSSQYRGANAWDLPDRLWGNEVVD